MSNSISGIDNMGYTFEMSPEQIIAVMTGATVRPENYQVVAYPKAVEAQFGHPITYYLAWERLTKDAIDMHKIPHYKVSFLERANHKNCYQEFLKDLDKERARLGLPVADRPFTERAWAQLMKKMYLKQLESGLVPEGWTKDRFMDLMKQRLAEAMEKRFDEESEKYWRIKGRDNPNLDVKCVSDNHENGLWVREKFGDWDGIEWDDTSDEDMEENEEDDWDVEKEHEFGMTDKEDRSDDEEVSDSDESEDMEVKISRRKIRKMTVEDKENTMDTD